MIFIRHVLTGQAVFLEGCKRLFKHRLQSIQKEYESESLVEGQKLLPSSFGSLTSASGKKLKEHTGGGEGKDPVTTNRL